MPAGKRRTVEQRVGRERGQRQGGDQSQSGRGHRRRLMRGVITSYSIHYTKLYDGLAELSADMRRDLGFIAPLIRPLRPLVTWFLLRSSPYLKGNRPAHKVS